MPINLEKLYLFPIQISLAFSSLVHYFKGFDIWSIDLDAGVDSETNKLLPFNAARDVGDSEEGAKLIEMLGDSFDV